jgi:hypothetical protein
MWKGVTKEIAGCGKRVNAAEKLGKRRSVKSAVRNRVMSSESGQDYGIGCVVQQNRGCVVIS